MVAIAVTPEAPDQSGVLTAAQAGVAFGRSHVRAQLTARRWQSPVRGVVVLHNGPLTDEQRACVALLGSAPGAALGGLSALVRDGLEGFVEPDIHVVVPEGSRRLDRPGVRPRDLRDALSRRGPCRHRALVVESILDAAGGIQSLPERDFELIRRQRVMPEPSRQAVRRHADGKCYLDVEWRAHEAACEIHGIPHLAVLQWESDLERANEVSIAGPRLLIFSSYAVRHEQPRVGDQLERLLRRGGWRG